MLLFDDSKRLEKAFGAEGAEVLAHILEKQSEQYQKELATKKDLEQGLLNTRADLQASLKELELKLTQRMFATAATSAGVIIAVLGFLIKF